MMVGGWLKKKFLDACKKTQLFIRAFRLQHIDSNQYPYPYPINKIQQAFGENLRREINHDKSLGTRKPHFVDQLELFRDFLLGKYKYSDLKAIGFEFGAVINKLRKERNINDDDIWAIYGLTLRQRLRSLDPGIKYKAPNIRIKTF